MVNKLFSSYLLVITGLAEMPTLSLAFEVGNERMAIAYGEASSRQIASEKYFHFALFVQTDDQQTLIAEWSVTFVPTIVELDLSREITT